MLFVFMSRSRYIYVYVIYFLFLSSFLIVSYHITSFKLTCFFAHFLKYLLLFLYDNMDEESE